MRTTIRWAALAVTGALSLVACGGGDSSPSAATGVTSAPTAITAPATTTPATPAAGATVTTTAIPASAKVSANDATRAELEQAFTAAGITNPSQWSREVVEYRPYATDDPTFAKLRQELAKYNPGPGVVDQIVAALAP